MFAMTRSHRIWKLCRRRSLIFLWAVWICALPGFSQDIQWVRSYREGMKLAKEDNRPVLIDFWSEWCLPCKQMDSELYTDLKVIEASRRFIFIRVDVDSDHDTPSRLGIKALPMKLFMDPWETVLLSVKGNTKPGELLEMMKPIPESFEPISESFMELEQNPNDSDALSEIGEFYRKAGFSPQADEFHARAEKAKGEAKAPIPRDEAQREANPPAVRPGIALETVPSRLFQSILHPGIGSYTPPTPIVDLSTSELLKKYPEELLGVEFDPNQDELGFLLEKVGKNVDAFFANFPNTLSKERIRQERLRADGRISSHVEQEVEYLLFLQKGGTVMKWSEERTNNKGKPVKLKRLPGESFLTSGFALECLLFLPGYQRTVRFRYLGRQSSEPYAHLIAFAQRPEKGGIPGAFQNQGVSVTIWRQGLVWVDPKTYQITRMRTDLLEPKPEAGLTRQTTEILYGEYQFSTNGVSLWLPREVAVTFEYGAKVYRYIHRYSDYRRFTVESYEKHEPVSRPQVPK
jgi:thiol-disulfide isomerase/thioredoxin